MRKISLFLWLLIQLNPLSAQTYFEQLGDLFYYGQRPAVEEILHRPYVGRCFHRGSPDTPKNIGFYVREKEQVDDVGPISRPRYELANYTFHNRSADFLDDKDHDFLSPYIEPLYESLETARHDLRFFNRQSGRKVWAYLRKNGDYFYQVFYDAYGREGNTRCYYWTHHL
ncbi:MAG TPA: hypothetical protein VKY27_00670 [Bacteriovoracaceae bacterium]|nr:hypothetical protein [Bacteriovoracaceae bacterium]